LLENGNFAKLRKSENSGKIFSDANTIRLRQTSSSFYTKIAKFLLRIAFLHVCENRNDIFVNSDSRFAYNSRKKCEMNSWSKNPILVTWSWKQEQESGHFILQSQARKVQQRHSEKQWEE
jgi:ribosomal protein L24E